MQSTNNVDLQKVRRLGNPVGSTQKCFIDDVAMQCSQSKQRNVMICYHLPYSLELRHPSQSERSPYAQSLGPKFGLEFPIGPTKRSAITVHAPRYIQVCTPEDARQTGTSRIPTYRRPMQQHSIFSSAFLDLGPLLRLRQNSPTNISKSCQGIISRAKQSFWARNKKIIQLHRVSGKWVGC